MAIKKISAGNTADIYYCPVARDPDAFQQGSADELPEKYCSRRKCELLTINYILHNSLGYKGKVHYENNGKPFLPGFDKKISISHSQNYAAVMISENFCGVDIEKISPRAFKVARKFLDPDEITHSGRVSNDLFYTLLWSAKESIFKITGKPDYLKQMHLLTPPLSTEGNILVGAEHRNGIKNFIVFYTTFDDHVLTWANE